jgi:hypothetical protein
MPVGPPPLPSRGTATGKGPVPVSMPVGAAPLPPGLPAKGPPRTAPLRPGQPAVAASSPATDAPPEGLSKLQLIKWKKDQAAQAAKPNATVPAASTGPPALPPALPPKAAPAPRPRSKTDIALADAPPGLSKLQAMAWHRRREHKRRALLKVRALIFMTGARGLAAAERNGGIVPRDALKPDEEADGGATGAPPPQVIARLAAKRGTVGRRLWVKVRSLVFMLGSAGLQQRCLEANRASKLVAPAGLNAKERIRWRGERKKNIKRALLKLRAVIAISGAAGLRDPNEPPPKLSSMEKLKWKAARKEELERQARETASASSAQPADGSFELQPTEDWTGAPFRTGSWAESRSPVPAVLSRVLGYRSPPANGDRRQSGSPRRQHTQPELDGVVAADDGSAATAQAAHEGVYGRTARRLEASAQAVEASVAHYHQQQQQQLLQSPQQRSPTGAARSHGQASPFLASRDRPRPNPSRSFSHSQRRQAQARSPMRSPARSPVKQYSRQQARPGPYSPRAGSPAFRVADVRQRATHPAIPAGGDEGGAYQNGLGMVSERIATLQMERAVLALRSDFEGLRRLADVEGELQATQAAIQLAREQLGRARRPSDVYHR